MIKLTRFFVTAFLAVSLAACGESSGESSRSGSVNMRNTTSVTITDKPGSLSIGISNEVESVYNDTAYRLPISVIATNINGHPLANQEISLSVWPIEYVYYRKVSLEESLFGWDPEWLPNEDRNRNVTRDPTDGWSEERTLCTSSGKKIDPNEPNKSQWAFDNNCTLLPPHASAGVLSDRVVTTDENGLATFTLTYVKHYSSNVKVELRASTNVQGTEMQATRSFVLLIPWAILAD